MDRESQLRDVIKEITQDGIFLLKKLICDDDNFGNALIVLTNMTFDLKFVSDRGDVWCEILIPYAPPEWFFLEDVITALGLPPVKHSADFSGNMRVVLDLVKKHKIEIEAAFRPENLQITMQRIQEIVNRRIQSTYGDVQLD